MPRRPVTPAQKQACVRAYTDPDGWSARQQRSHAILEQLHHEQRRRIAAIAGVGRDNKRALDGDARGRFHHDEVELARERLRCPRHVAALDATVLADQTAPANLKASQIQHVLTEEGREDEEGTGGTETQPWSVAVRRQRWHASAPRSGWMLLAHFKAAQPSCSPC